MEMRRESAHLSTDDGLKLFTRMNVPAEAGALVILVHGLAEHCGRYDQVTKEFNDWGYGVIRFDNRGHGHSEGERGYVEDFRHLIHDAHKVVQVARDEYPELPLFMLGHSMGGFIAAGYGVMYPGELRGQILSGPVVVELPLAQDLKGLDPEVGPDSKSENSLSQLICRDPMVVAQYEQDPLVLEEITHRIMIEVLLHGSQWLTANLDQYRDPCLILHGGDDNIVPPESAHYMHDHVGSEDKKIIVYPGLYHEILNEPERAQVLADIRSWLESRV